MIRDKKKVIIFTSLILGVLVVTLGITYSLFTFNETGGTSKLILGDIYMHYKETNQLSLSDAMPLDINNYITYKVNPIMQEQEIVDNELSRCITYFEQLGISQDLDEGSTTETFCQGTGTIDGGLTIQENFDAWIEDSKEYGYDFLEDGGQELLDAGVILSNGDGTYTVNPIMQEQDINELTACVSFYSRAQLDEGSTAESFCQGTGRMNGGMTFQDLIDLISPDPSFLEYGGQYFLDAGVILHKIENLPYFEFTISGKNTYTKEDIWYEIVLSHGSDHDTRTTRIRDDLLKFTLIEVANGKNNILVDNKSYSDLTNKRIYVDTIDADTKTEINRTYRLYMWISDETVLGNVNEDYTLEEWNDVFASVKVNVSGDFKEKIIDTHESCFIVGTINNNGETEVAIRDYDASCGSDVVIPETIKGYKVGVIGNQMTGTLISSDDVNNQDILNNLVLNNDDHSNIKPMAAMAGAFTGKGLTSVVIPNTVREIYDLAFADNRLTNIEIPNSVIEIENSAFERNQLTSVVIPNSVSLIGVSAFAYNNLKTVTIGSGITFIGRDAFSKNDTSNPNLETITFTNKACEEIKVISNFPWLDYSSPYYQEGYKANIIGTDGVCSY